MARDRSVMTLTTSSRLTARRVHDDAARDLAAAVATYLVSSTTRNAVEMHQALKAFTDARNALDG